jgi:hypothetical protein
MYSWLELGLRGLVCALAAVSLVVLSGCVIVPVRLPTQTKDISGKVQKLDFTFLEAGSTTRDAVTKNLAPIDTHANEAEFFWGRWESSKWAVGGFAGLGYGAVAGGGRVWGARNIFVNFDQKGIVSSWTVVDDKKLFHQLDLQELVASSSVAVPPLTREIELPSSSQIQAIHTANLTFSEESVGCGDIQISRGNIRKIAITAEEAQHPSADHVWITRHLLKRTSTKKGVKSLTMGVDPPTLLLLRHYIEQTKSVPSRPVPTAALIDMLSRSLNE